MQDNIPYLLSLHIILKYGHDITNQTFLRLYSNVWHAMAVENYISIQKQTPKNVFYLFYAYKERFLHWSFSQPFVRALQKFFKPAQL